MCFFGCPSHCALPRAGKKEHQSAEGLLCLPVLPTFPNHVNSVLRAGITALTALLQLLYCMERDNLPWSHIHTFSQIWLPLLSSHERIKSTESGFLSPSFPHPHTRLERNTASFFSLRSAGEHRLLQFTAYGALASEAVSCSHAPVCLLACGRGHERKGSNAILLIRGIASTVCPQLQPSLPVFVCSLVSRWNATSDLHLVAPLCKLLSSPAGLEDMI